MFEVSVECVGGAVAGVGVVEVGQDVAGSFLQCSSQGDVLSEGGRYAMRDRGDRFLHESFAFGALGLTVGSDHLLVHALQVTSTGVAKSASKL